MKTWSLPLLLLITLFSLIGCGGRSTVTHVIVPPPQPPINVTPELVSFNMLDSYDVDTRIDNHTPLALSPYLYNGMFDIFWRVNSLEDYIVELRINDRPGPQASFLVHSELCGAGLWCDQSGKLTCEYTNNFELACGAEDFLDVSELFQTVPQELYLVLQICDADSHYCEYDYYPVWME